MPLDVLYNDPHAGYHPSYEAQLAIGLAMYNPLVWAATGLYLLACAAASIPLRDVMMETRRVSRGSFDCREGEWS